MQNGVDAVGIDQQVEHLLLLPLESTVEKQVCYNLESKGKLFVRNKVKYFILINIIMQAQERST